MAENKDNVYRLNDNPCTQQTKRCYYPWTKDIKITSYLCCKNHLIELLSYIIKVLDENDIIYFLDYGTLIGCVRNRSFIPWDTDIDISVIDDSKLNKVLAIISKNNKNYNLVKESNNFYRLNFSKKNTLHIDISIRKKQSNNVYTDKYPEKYWGIHEKDLFPLKIVSFENLDVKIPQNSKKYLENGYGIGCITNPQTHGDKLILRKKKTEKKIQQTSKKKNYKTTEKSKFIIGKIWQ